MSTTGAAAAMAVRTESVKSWNFMFDLGWFVFDFDRTREVVVKEERDGVTRSLLYRYLKAGAAGR